MARTRHSPQPSRGAHRMEALTRILDEDVGDLDEGGDPRQWMETRFPHPFVVIAQDPMTELYRVSDHASKDAALTYLDGLDDGDYVPDRLIDLDSLKDYPILRKYVLGTWKT